MNAHSTKWIKHVQFITAVKMHSIIHKC